MAGKKGVLYMAYRVSIDTSSYKDRKCSEKNWEPGTMNDFMHAINGWVVRENNLKELRWRLMFIAHIGGYPSDSEEYEKYKLWMERHKNKNKIKFKDILCDLERIEPVRMYGFAQGYINIDKVIDKVLKEGSAKIQFRSLYDSRQYIKNLDGCYILIEKC